jgi:hypothetical protein
VGCGIGQPYGRRTLSRSKEAASKKISGFESLYQPNKKSESSGRQCSLPSRTEPTLEKRIEWQALAEARQKGILQG